MRVQQNALAGCQDHEAILLSSYLQDIPDALTRWQVKRILLVVSTSLDTTTDVIQQLEMRLSAYQVFKKTGIGKHSPYADVIDIANLVQMHSIDVVVSIGSGSYSDACKAALMLATTLPPGFNTNDVEMLVDPVTGLASSLQAPTTKLICVPTSLSAGEWSHFASATNPQGKKQHFTHPCGAPSLILLDPRIGATTPEHLWLASGMRAVDHFVESLCYPGCPKEAQETIISGLRNMLCGLREYRTSRGSMDEAKLLHGISTCQLAAREALVPFLRWGVRFGASHAMGHQLVCM
jgi:alcohol dehydrogenase class IV